MSWVRLDDKSAFHRKVADAGNEAWGAFCRAAAWSADQLTDGVVPWSIARQIAKKKVWKKLADVGFLDHVTDQNFELHDYLKWNPPGDAVRAKREHTSAIRREAGKRGAAKRWQSDSKEHGKTMANGIASASQSDDPVPVPIEKREHARASAPGNLDPIAAELGRHPVFAPVAVGALAMLRGRQLSSGKKPEWIAMAIADCAADVGSLGLTSEILMRKLRTYADHARAPRESSTGMPIAASIMPLESISERETRLAQDREREAARPLRAARAAEAAKRAAEAAELKGEIA